MPIPICRYRFSREKKGNDLQTEILINLSILLINLRMKALWLRHCRSKPLINNAIDPPALQWKTLIPLMLHEDLLLQLFLQELLAVEIHPAAIAAMDATLREQSLGISIWRKTQEIVLEHPSLNSHIPATNHLPRRNPKSRTETHHQIPSNNPKEPTLRATTRTREPLPFKSPTPARERSSSDAAISRTGRSR